MPVPPKLVRRLVIAPAAALLAALLILAAPLLLLLAVLASPFLGGWRPVRMLAVVIVYTGRHLGATIACLWLWVASGFGRTLGSERMQRAHYAVLGWFVSGIYRTVVRVARVEVRSEASAEAEALLSAARRPVLALSRHAGEGDSLLVVEHLLCRYGREPRLVMHDALRLDPLLDVLGERLPNRFLDPRGGDTEQEIAAMASELSDAAAVVIFPEGANFSPSHRERGIERLERAGYPAQAERARAMRHLSAPRPGGTLAALEAAAGADVVFIAHVGFPTGFRELWRLLPVDQTVHVRMWVVPGEEVPASHGERIEWLFESWERLDRWIGSRQPRGD